MTSCRRTAFGLCLALTLATHGVVSLVRADEKEGAGRINPSALQYVGAFRLPKSSGGSNWEYSGYAMTYFPEGDRGGPDDGFPGSLFAVGHDHHQQVSEISIPAPVRSRKLESLNTAKTLQPFADVTSGRFGELEIPRAGIEYLPPRGSGKRGKLHFCWGQHFQFERQPSHGWSELDLAAPRTAGPWRLGTLTNYVTNDYLLAIPKAWADANTPGKHLAAGRFRDGTWGGLGPALLAYAPPAEDKPLEAGATLKDVTVLLLYGTPQANRSEIAVKPDRKLTNFKEADEWSGAAWLTAGRMAAVVFVGTKATGASWYGFSNGVVYPTSGDPNDPVPPVPPWPHDSRGWWSKGIEAQLLFYDPADLAAVAAGKLDSWKPQPYATLTIDQHLFDAGFDHKRAKQHLLGAAAFDRARGHLFLMERRADGDKSVVHVFRVASK